MFQKQPDSCWRDIIRRFFCCICKTHGISSILLPPRQPHFFSHLSRCRYRMVLTPLPEKGHKQPFDFNFLLSLFLCAWFFFVCVFHSSNFIYINPHNNYDLFLSRPRRSQVEQKRGGRKFGWDTLTMLFFYLLFN